MVTTVEQHKQVLNAAEQVWQQIGMDIPEDRVSTADMLETSLDANRLEQFGHTEEEQLFQAMLKEHGYEETIKLLAVHSQFEWHEGGGKDHSFY